MNDPAYIRKRLLRYFVPVVALAVLINVPKFFEIMPYWVPEEELYGTTTAEGEDATLQGGVEAAAAWAVNNGTGWNGEEELG